MSDENASSPEVSETPASPPKARRISNPKPRKTATKKAKGGEAPAVEPKEVASQQAPISEPAASVVPEPKAEVKAAEPKAQEVKAEGAPQAGGDWPEPEPAGGGSSSENKRKRRRRKGKGQSGQGPQSGAAQDFESAGEASEAPQAQAPVQQTQNHQPQRPQHQPQPVQRPRLDSDELAKRAWKIFLAEVSEEGVALIGDQDARELSKRCFRLAELFLEEQARRR